MRADAQDVFEVASWLYVCGGDVMMNWRKLFCVFDIATCTLSTSASEDGPFVPLLRSRHHAALSGHSSAAGGPACRAIVGRVVGVKEDAYDGVAHSVNPPTDAAKHFGFSVVVADADVPKHLRAQYNAASGGSATPRATASAPSGCLAVRLCATTKRDALKWKGVLRNATA